MIKAILFIASCYVVVLRKAPLYLLDSNMESGAFLLARRSLETSPNNKHLLGFAELGMISKQNSVNFFVNSYIFKLFIMKYILILLSIFFFTFNIKAQDTILLKNGEIINASIIEKTNCKIKYQSTQNTNRDTIIDLKLSKIKTIDYCSKSKDILIQQNPRNKYPLGMNVGMESLLFRLYLFNGSIHYLITPKLSAEIN